jgi:hypothetical protein
MLKQHRALKAVDGSNMIKRQGKITYMFSTNANVFPLRFCLTHPPPPAGNTLNGKLVERYRERKHCFTLTL